LTVFDDDETQYHNKVAWLSYPTNAWFESALAASTAPWKIVIAIIRFIRRRSR